MAPTTEPLVVQAEDGKLSPEQVLKASRALLAHLASTTTTASKPDLLASPSDTTSPIYLTLTTKKHIIDKKRLKPAKIALPHPIHTSPTATILLITADPQRTYKDIVASPAFPAALRQRITRVIDVGKLKKKYGTYEAQRQLRDACDMVLADDRVVAILPRILGKTFYKTTKHRPVPVDIAGWRNSADGKRAKAPKRDVDTPKTAGSAASIKQIAAELERALGSTLVYLSPSTLTAVKVGLAGWEPAQLAANVEAVAAKLIETHVPKKWKGVRSLYIKGENTMALPIWLTSELWVGEEDVLDAEAVQKMEEDNMSKKQLKKALAAKQTPEEKVEEKAAAEAESKKRKAAPAGSEKEKKSKKAKVVVGESNDAKLDEEIAARKALLKKQKAEAAAAVAGDDVPKAKKARVAA